MPVPVEVLLESLGRVPIGADSDLRCGHQAH
jgi:hypothetical protein